MGQRDLQPVILEHVDQPIPVERRLDDDLQPGTERAQLAQQQLRVVRQPAAQQLAARRVHDAQPRGSGSEIETGVA
jgi:hypothetical protein